MRWGISRNKVFKTMFSPLQSTRGYMNADGTRTMTTHMYRNLDFVFIYIILTFLLLTRINLDLTVLLRCITTGFFLQ